MILSRQLLALSALLGLSTALTSASAEEVVQPLPDQQSGMSQASEQVFMAMSRSFPPGRGRKG